MRPRSGDGPVVGLDLAGSPRRPTGCCVLRSATRLVTSVCHADEEILALVGRVGPRLVVLDAPLSLPRGRRSLRERSGPDLRICDRELQRLGIRFFPLTLGPMRALTARGMRIAGALAARGIPALEGYPGGSQDLLGLPRKSSGVGALQAGLMRLGLAGDLRRRGLTHDELDAVTIAWVGREFLRRRAILIGDPREGQMLLPRDRRAAASKAAPLGRARGEGRAA